MSRTTIPKLTLALAAALSAPAGFAAPQDPGSAAKPPAKPADLVPVESFFKGKVTSVAGNVVELSYDFSDLAQLQDFEPSVPFRAIRTIEYSIKQGRVLAQGTGSMRHRAVFDGEAAASATFVPRKPRDFGFAVSEERESEVFTLYCCYDKYFGAGDNVYVPQNMIIKFIPRDPKVNKDGFQDWRYCGSRGQKPEIQVGRKYRVGLERAANESRMTIEPLDAKNDAWESKGKEAGRDLTTQMVAVYLYDSHVEVDDLVVRGKLSTEYVAKHRIDLTSWKPPAPPPTTEAPKAPEAPTVSDEVAERIRTKIAGYPLETKPQALAQLLRDATIPAALRAEAAEKAKTTGLKKIVPFLVDGLYSEDADARRLSFDVLKALTGKSFGYRPDGTEDSRKKAIRDLNDHLAKYPAEFM